MKRAIWDIETNGLYWEATKVHCMAFIDVDARKGKFFGPDQIEEGIKFLESLDEIIGHNILNYDIPVMEKLYPDIKIRRQKTVDTLILSRLLYPEIETYSWAVKTLKGQNEMIQIPGAMLRRHSLESWGYRLGIYKGNYGKGDAVWGTYTDEMGLYCQQDARVNLRLYEKLVAEPCDQRAIDLEHDVQRVISKQEINGWPFDIKKAEALYEKLRDKRAALEQQLLEVFPGKSVEMKTPIYYTITWNDQTFRASTKGKVVDEAWAALKGTPGVFKTKLGGLSEPGPVKTEWKPFNPYSGPSIAAALSGKYGWVPTVFTETKQPKVDEEVLSGLPYPEGKLILEVQVLQDRIEKLKTEDEKYEDRVKQTGRKKGGSKKANGWIDHYKPETGCIHGSVITNGAVTGRATHRNPNLAQVPANGAPFGSECRELFVAQVAC